AGIAPAWAESRGPIAEPPRAGRLPGEDGWMERLYPLAAASHPRKELLRQEAELHDALAVQVQVLADDQQVVARGRDGLARCELLVGQTLDVLPAHHHEKGVRPRVFTLDVFDAERTAAAVLHL